MNPPPDQINPSTNHAINGCAPCRVDSKRRRPKGQDLGDIERVKKSLSFSMKDGIFASAMTGFTQDYFTPFLLLLGGTSRDVGILSSLPNFCAALIQLKSADLTEKTGSRKTIINIFVFLQALMLIPMAAAAFSKGTSPLFFIILEHYLPPSGLLPIRSGGA